MDYLNLGLAKLEEDVLAQLGMINYPHPDWVQSNDAGIDVAIVGAGMAGISVAFALMRQGINRIALFDQREEGFEGPWITYARMRTLRSGKELTGPSLDFPALTYHSWYRSQWGEESWDSFRKAPNSSWMDYLRWLTKILGLPVHHHTRVDLVSHAQDRVRLVLQRSDGFYELPVRKAVLATGRDGYGGARIPAELKSLAKHLWAHTNEHIHFEKFAGKKIAVLGAGASAFDAAAVALEHGVESVDVILRRKSIPNVNKMAHMVYAGYAEGYYLLEDDQKLQLMEEIWQNGTPPPIEALERVKVFSNITIHYDCCLKKVTGTEKALLTTDRFEKEFDFVIAGTGFAIDGSEQTELREIYPHIRTWDRYPAEKFPYLGNHFQFLPSAGDEYTYSWLKNVYCFNYAATATHGVLSSDIPAIGVGALRLARGIAADFFNEDYEKHLANLVAYDHLEFNTYENLYPS